MPMVESAFNNCQINVPPRLPLILKQFCKAAIRTQPYDLLKWSSAYFRALADGEEPPTKIRLECPLPQTISGLTLGFLRVLLRQFGDYNKIISIEAILRRWDDLCLDRRDLNLIMIIGKFRRKCQVKKFLAIAVGLLGSSLLETMLMICELFTLEPDGGSAMIPVTLFVEIYGYLAGLRCDGSKRQSFDDDPSEFLIFDKADVTNSPEVCTSERDSNVMTTGEQVSFASQDTEADIDVDLESSSKDERDSDTKRTPEVTSKSSNRSESSLSKDERKLSKINLKKSEIPDTDAGESMKSLSGDCGSKENASKSEKEESSSSIENDCDDSSNQVTLTSNFPEADDKNDENISSDNAKKKRTEDLRLLSYYPKVPGIGRRLAPEQVAVVAMWMTECAKLQKGMVGPRNLRHLQCPSLDNSES